MVQMGTWYQQNTEVSYLRANVEGLELPPARNCPPLSRSPSPTWVAILWRCSGPDYGFAVSTNSKVKSAATTFALWLSSTKAGQLRVADNFDEYPVLTTLSPDFSALRWSSPASKHQTSTSCGAGEPGQETGMHRLPRLWIQRS